MWESSTTSRMSRWRCCGKRVPALAGGNVHCVDILAGQQLAKIVVRLGTRIAVLCIYRVVGALAKFLPVAPFTVEAGRSLELDAAITVRSQAECLRLSHAPACNGGIDDVFQVMFDGGLAQCAARLICTPDDRGEGAAR